MPCRSKFSLFTWSWDESRLEGSPLWLNNALFLLDFFPFPSTLCSEFSGASIEMKSGDSSPLSPQFPRRRLSCAFAFHHQAYKCQLWLRTPPPLLLQETPSATMKETRLPWWRHQPGRNRNQTRIPLPVDSGAASAVGGTITPSPEFRSRWSRWPGSRRRTSSYLALLRTRMRWTGKRIKEKSGKSESWGSVKGWKHKLITMILDFNWVYN